MTKAQKIASRLRWFLLVLWVLCLLVGIFWLMGVLFDFGAGLVGSPSMAFWPFTYLIGSLNEIEGSGGYLLFVFIYLAFFFMSQWFFLCPRHIWKVRLETTGWPMKRSAISAAFVIMLLLVGLLYSILDLFSENFVDDVSSPSSFLGYLFLLIPLFLWCFWSVIFCIYRRQSEHYTWAGRIVRGLIAGSVLELFVAVPVYATHQDDCYCAKGSYAGLVFGGTVLLWAFGPGIFFLFIRERQRREKLLDSQESSGPTNAGD